MTWTDVRGCHVTGRGRARGSRSERAGWKRRDGAAAIVALSHVFTRPGRCVQFLAECVHFLPDVFSLAGDVFSFGLHVFSFRWRASPSVPPRAKRGIPREARTDTGKWLMKKGRRLPGRVGCWGCGSTGPVEDFYPANSTSSGQAHHEPGWPGVTRLCREWERRSNQMRGGGVYE